MIVRDRQEYEEKAEDSEFLNMIKQYLFPNVKYILEENGIPESESKIRAEAILLRNSVKRVIDFLDSPLR